MSELNPKQIVKDRLIDLNKIQTAVVDYENSRDITGMYNFKREKRLGDLDELIVLNERILLYLEN